jgi:hypothetical protein
MVPATLASTSSHSDPGGILAKSAGSFFDSTFVQGPVNAFALYHRPEIRI